MTKKGTHHGSYSRERLPLGHRGTQLVGCLRGRAANYWLNVGIDSTPWTTPCCANRLSRSHISRTRLGPFPLGGGPPHWARSLVEAFILAHANPAIQANDSSNYDSTCRGWPWCPRRARTHLPRRQHSEIYPDKFPDAEGMRSFFKQLSPSPATSAATATPETAPARIMRGVLNSVTCSSPRLVAPSSTTRPDRTLAAS